VYCQFAFLRRCIKTKDIERTLNTLPKTLEGTYTRILEEIDNQNWKYAHIIFQCVAAAFRPLRVDELSQFLIFDSETESTSTSQADDELLGDPADTVLSMCSSLLTVVDLKGFGSPVVQFAHFTVKEYLTATLHAEPKDTISRFRVSMTSAHTTVAQGCLDLLLRLDDCDDDAVTKDSQEDFLLADYAADYAAECWFAHAQIKDVSSKVEDRMKRLFDPSKHHLSDWARIKYREDHPGLLISDYGRYKWAMDTPLHYATFCGMHDIVKFLIVKHSQDVNARGFKLRLKETPLHVALCRGHADIAQLLLEHGADVNAQNDGNDTPLHLSSEYGDLEVVRILLERGADKEAQDGMLRSPLSRASLGGHVEVCRLLLEHGADTKSRDFMNLTPLHYAEGEEVARLLLKYGADANVLDGRDQTLLHNLSPRRLGVARVLLEHGVDVDARDARNATPLHVASANQWPMHMDMTDAVRLLLRYGPDINAQDNEGRTPFMRATAGGMDDIMRLLLDNGAEDHRK
jgi:ankyrin repeat protein